MTSSIRYECDGRTAVWPIPFAYALESEVGVTLQRLDGTERRLAPGVDYLVNGSVVYSVQPAGARLIIWQDAAPATPAQLVAAYSARDVAQPAAQAAQAIQIQDQAETVAAIDAKLATALAQLDEWTKAGLKQLETGLADKLKEALGQIALLVSDATRQIREATSQLESRGQSMALAMERNAETASRAANAASLASNTISAARDAQGNAAITAQGWANASQKSADESWRASASAWDAATQASIHARRPGVCSVHSIADIHACSPGLFIVNEHLTHAPTPFFGVWPAQKIEDMAWDAVFFTSPYLYPDDPRLPPPAPEKPKPSPVAAEGSPDQWLPCGHQHEDEILYSTCPVRKCG